MIDAKDAGQVIKSLAAPVDQPMAASITTGAASLFQGKAATTNKGRNKNMNTKEAVTHTPGPWTYDESWALIKGDDGSEIAAVHAARAFRAPKGKDAFKDEPKANARLIAAAPDLLAALQKMTALLAAHPDGGLYPDYLIQARAAILRATGGK